MALDLVALCIGAYDPAALAHFWSDVLGRELVPDEHDPDAVMLLPDDDTGFRLRYLPTPEVKARPNRMHIDLTSSSLEDQEQKVARALELGGRHLDVGQGPDATHVVLADPEGNEFCVIAPGNHFLADTGALGALACDGTQAVGYFWSKALDWPLVWDQDEETAIQSHRGGSKISWGGPPVGEKVGRNRWHVDLAASGPADRDAELVRLIALGAALGDGGLVDPDGNEFCVCDD